jgi:ligand-binding sensor domain-containing protein
MGRPSRHATALLLFAAAVGASAGAARALPALPLYGGDVRALVFDPREPARAFAGTAAGQVYRSDDAGSTWREAGGTVPFPNWVVGALLFDPQREGRLWAGLRGLWSGGGVAYSDDFGVTWVWRAADGLSTEPVYALTAAPQVADRLYAATRGGVWRSDDAGAAWRKVSTGVAGLDQVGSLAVDPRRPERLVAGTWRRAFRSDDGGETWRSAFDGMVLDTEVFQLVVDRFVADGLWAATCGWIYRGDAFGERWTRVQTGFGERRTRALARLSAERVVVGTVAGAYYSDDGGASFTRAADPGLSIVALAHHPQRPELVLAATDGAGIWRSVDGGLSYEPASRGLAALRVAALVAHDGSLYAAVPWAGALAGVYRSRDGGGRFERLEPPLAAPVGVAVAEGRLFAASAEALYAREGDGWRLVAGGGGERIGGLRSVPGGFAVEVDGRARRWRDGRLVASDAATPDAAAASASEPRPPATALAWLPAGAVRAAAPLAGRWVLATSGFGLRWADAPAGSVALEAGEDPQVGGEALGGDR